MSDRQTKSGAASGTVMLAEFNYNKLACQVPTMAFFDSVGNNVTDTLTQGMVFYEYLAGDFEEWRPFDIAPRNILTDGTNQVPQVTGTVVRKVRATFAGFPAGTTFQSAVIALHAPTANIDSRIMGGNQAINIQPFVEANSKNGTQYEAAFYIPSLAAGASAYVLMQVGAQPVALKDVQVGFKSLLLSVDTWRNPSFTGGTPIPVFNMNDELAVPDDVTLLANPVVTNNGTQVSPSVYTLGTQDVGNRIVGTISNTVGVERILWRNSTYLLRVTNRDTVNATAITAVAT